MWDNIGSVVLISLGRGWIRSSWTAMVMDGELIAAKNGELLQVIAASPLHRDAHKRTQMHTDTHRCTQMHTDAHKRTQTRTDAHKCTQTHTNAHKCTQMHSDALRLLQLKVHRPFKCISTCCTAQVRASRDYSDHEASPLL